MTNLTQSPRGPRSEWDAFVIRLASAVDQLRHPEGVALTVLADCASRLMAPATRLLAQALLIRLEKSADGLRVSLTLLEQQLALPSQALNMLVASSAEADEPRARRFLAGVASGMIRSCSDIEGIAHEADISVPHLSRLVYRETHVSVQRHIDVRRLLAAAHLVSKTFVRLDEIAATVGYEHPRHLERRFLAVLGVRPTELRGYCLREACRAHLRGRNNALFASWVSNRLPMLIAHGDGPNWLRQMDY